MSKINFSKVEELIAKERLNQQVQDLQKKGAEASRAKGQNIVEHISEEEHDRLLKGIQRDLHRIHRYDPDIYKDIGIQKKEIDKAVQHPKTLTSDDWLKLKQLRQLLDSHLKKPHPAQQPSSTDEEIVEAEKKKHINKRFNVKESWLPLK